jgi:hypothetical protein
VAKYPLLFAGQRLTAGLLAKAQTDNVIKTSDTSRTNATFAADPDLQISLEGSATYYIEILLVITAAPSYDIKTQWTLPTGASGNRRVEGPASGATDANADNIDTRWGVHGGTTPINYGARGSAGSPTVVGSQFHVRETGVIVTTDPGVLTLDWAQNFSNAAATTVYTRSSISASRWA